MLTSPLGQRSRAVVGLSMIAALSTLPIGLVSETQVGGVDVHAEQTSACSAILSAWGSSLNSTYFREACAEPSFQAAFDQWGLSNFTTGSGGGRGWVDNYYEFDWVGACTNASMARFGLQCSFQEYWTANLTSGTLSGPTVQEGPSACGCGMQPAPGLLWLSPFLAGPGLSALGVLLAGCVASASVVLVMALRREGHRPPANSAQPDSR